MQVRGRELCKGRACLYFRSEGGIPPPLPPPLRRPPPRCPPPPPPPPSPSPPPPSPRPPDSGMRKCDKIAQWSVMCVHKGCSIVIFRSH
jgi:hypothetical protein